MAKVNKPTPQDNQIITDSGFAEALILASSSSSSSLQSFQKLGLNGFTHTVGNKTIQILSENCPDLTYLCLPSSTITGRGLQSLVKNCKKLRFLLLNGAKSIEKRSDLFYLLELPHLNQLNLQNSNVITTWDDKQLVEERFAKCGVRFYGDYFPTKNLF